MSMNWEAFGRLAYETHRNGLKAGIILPTWDELSPELKLIWIKVACAVIETYSRAILA